MVEAFFSTGDDSLDRPMLDDAAATADEAEPFDNSIGLSQPSRDGEDAAFGEVVFEEDFASDFAPREGDVREHSVALATFRDWIRSNADVNWLDSGVFAIPARIGFRST